MSTYLLIHGAFHGGWVWQRVTPLLEGAGHRVLAPSLVGLGDRADLLTADVGLDTHVRDLIDLVTSEDLTGVVLVGHSYGGIVVTALADAVPDRIAELVYIDTFVPRDGEAVADIMPGMVEAFAAAAAATGDGWRVPPQTEPSGDGGLYGVTEEPDLGWVASMQTPQSLKTFQQPMTLTDPAALAAIPVTHVHCGEGGEDFKAMRAAMPRTLPPADLPPDRLHVLPTGHDCMITMPRELAGCLLELSARPAPAP
ncbi:alpha/beta fold hydrolase [Nocardia abscessus]|uniref:alpha/beta fold hydrolase n=1 Tax=Nocardia TaxID=1817 RepID=UPI001894F343|nr:MULTISPECIES: alpha/beta hydrolase family protein [Nocardia]MBF6223268.1 alpha/beta fold hydrolase [Nocardia abscessus]MDE1674558.1 alpha/beta hydrolase [Nocardia gipuzkoensis]UGT66806.1 alpha/beta fold hydrolase [Nocardia gipuzkoensis]